LAFLWPQIVPEEIAPSVKNDDSLVFRIRYGQRSFLLPERLQQAGVPTLRTDQNGAIHIAANGKILQVSCFDACPQIQS